MIKPTRGKVLVELLGERVSSGGLIVSADDFDKYKINTGTVKAVGDAPRLKDERKKWDGKILQKSKYAGDEFEEVVCEEGDAVFFKTGFYKKYRDNDKKMLFINYSDIIGVIKEGK